MMITSCHIDQDSSGKIHEANIGADGAGKRTVRGTWEITYRTIARLDAFPSPLPLRHRVMSHQTTG